MIQLNGGCTSLCNSSWLRRCPPRPGCGSLQRDARCKPWAVYHGAQPRPPFGRLLLHALPVAPWSSYFPAAPQWTSQRQRHLIQLPYWLRKVSQQRESCLCTRRWRSMWCCSMWTTGAPTSAMCGDLIKPRINVSVGESSKTWAI